MSGQALPVAVFCLATGAALGCLFLLFQGMSQLLGLKKLGTALVDVLFCCLCGGFVFLCALAVDSGRLRLYQAALQGLGAWCVVAAFGPLARWGIARLRKILGSFAPFWANGRASRWGICGKGRPPGPILAKNRKKAEKTEKKDLKNLCIPGYNKAYYGSHFPGCRRRKGGLLCARAENRKV